MLHFRLFTFDVCRILTKALLFQCFIASSSKMLILISKVDEIEGGEVCFRQIIQYLGKIVKQP